MALLPGDARVLLSRDAKAPLRGGGLSRDHGRGYCVRRPAGRAAPDLAGGYAPGVTRGVLCGRGDEGQFEVDGDLVADQNSAGFQNSVPGQAEVLAADGGFSGD